ncbi:MAG: replicative DNA helicase [Bacilli bacterium]|nr:replicative DNA helicase [Bacilli bacterium]MDD4808636.1 replicative DNA helicase [Bacilli bacterium]
MAERVMPHSIEAEQSVLGSLFLSKYALQKGIESLSSNLFYLDSHAKIFTVISDLAEKGTPVDITTVTAELDKRKWLQQVGGVEYLTELVNMLPSASNADEYIRLVNEKAVLRRLIEEATQIVTSGYNSTDSINEVLDSAEMKILNVVRTRKGTEFKTIQEVLFKAQSDLEKLAKNKGEITGIPSGFYDLDSLTSGFHPNELIIIAARPGVGKTALALNIATNVAMNTDKTVAVFNMEMSAEQLVIRMLAQVGQIDGNKLKNGWLEHNDWKRVNEAISRLADTKMYIDDTPGMTISEIRAKCRRLASSEDGLGLVIIDYLTLIQGTSRYAGNRQQEVAEISRGLKTMAMELGVPVISLAQLSRNVEGRESKRPLLSDLRESGAIEQDADIVSFLHRPDYYGENTDEPTSEVELIIAKHRNGPTKDIKLFFQKNTNTFINVINKEEDR